MIELDEKKEELLTRFLKEIISSKHNLTAIKDFKQAYIKHVEDVLLAVRKLNLCGRYIDIGTGGGVPGIVCAVLFPEAEWYLLDSVGKKVQEIERISLLLGLSNVHFIVGRAEEVAKGYAEFFDGAFLRAVGRADISLEYGTPFVCRTGIVYLFKGPLWREEKEYAERAAKILNLQLKFEKSYYLSDGAERFLVGYERTGELPAGIPRRPGIPKKRPLGGKWNGK
ncbi:MULTISPECIES: 16S rRNA (guanine(527)-N(7))-methyltransferase RsmG [Kosmotoga]|jgi:16S rRNA (guanine527-N7)-methyltransferase|uniref:Ribosomal RNA small subunit methyltransferase G n=1 Tax=Kosmotoga olearia (strain ATCC BAA-1733 / DSM 21960 / TBF 19.5.1) TaxID=521045 RepID=C5CEC1_KOSOT|nr:MULTISPECIES: 16S rRNA (guanine(527)-N(7))-methyltransferase RsmG [Kosmotoga]ACR80161.1 methyltransferase GidB [Kosmotoga olearia TBF 19.5.1]MDI3523840.1 rRNA (guanine527-N7)-methyltransferase [Kosmotoga sp.]MDK2953236.1 rRNA (guanine527-N7)-methyltransferase [Kosmotoga sp.]